MSAFPRPVPPPPTKFGPASRSFSAGRPASPQPAPRAGIGGLQPKPAPFARTAPPPPTKFAPAAPKPAHGAGIGGLQPKPAHRAATGKPCCDACAEHGPAAPKPAQRAGAGGPRVPAAAVQPSKKHKKQQKIREQAALNWKRYVCYSPNSAAQYLKHHDEGEIVTRIVNCGLGTQAAYPGHCSGKKGSNTNNATPGKLEAIRDCLDGMG